MRRILITGLLVAARLAAQPHFDVVSIKPCTSSPQNGDVSATPRRLRLECVTADSLIRGALIGYRDGRPWPVRNGVLAVTIPPSELHQEIRGSSGWIKSERFTIDATSDSPTSIEMMRGPMMQVVLRDRFRLQVHNESREIPTYGLVVAKGGPRFQPAKQGGCVQMTPDTRPPAPLKHDEAPTIFCGGFHLSKKGGLDVEGIPLTYLCNWLAPAMGRDLIDETGLSGLYDLHLELTFADILPHLQPATPPIDPNALPEAAEPGGSVVSALHKLGLQLKPGKRMAQFLVIDHIEKPVAN